MTNKTKEIEAAVIPAKSESQAVTIQADTPVATIQPVQLLQMAIEKGSDLDLDRMERLMDMQMRWEKKEAEKAFSEAMGNFKQNPPEILKTGHVNYSSQKGVTDYYHAKIGEIAEQVNTRMAEFGLNFNWSTEQKDGMVYVTCIVKHKLGGQDSTTLAAPPDPSGGKNSIQAIGSTIRYLQRYTLESITGIVPKDAPDDDGLGFREEGPRLSADDLKYIRSTLTKLNREEEKFIKYITKPLNLPETATLQDIPSSAMNRIKAILDAALARASKDENHSG